MQLERTKVNSLVWISKNTALIIFFIAIAISALNTSLQKFLEAIHISNNISVVEYIFGYILSFLLAYSIHFLAFFYVKESSPTRRIKSKYLLEKFWIKTFLLFVIDSEGEKKKSNGIKVVGGFMLKVFSPDYSLANTFKAILLNKELNQPCPRKNYHPHLNEDREKDCKKNNNGVYLCEIHSQKNRRKDFIIYSNWLNIISVCIISILALFKIGGVFISFLGFHVLSRMIEVVFSFYKDVVQSKMTKEKTIGYKSSNLKRGNRISLALHSYLEFIFLFACIYYLLGKYMNDSFAIKGITSFIDFFVYSMSVSAYNYSLDLGATTFGRVIHIAQVFTSMTLVVLSVATYLGLKDRMSVYEKKEWEDNKYT